MGAGSGAGGLADLAEDGLATHRLVEAALASARAPHVLVRLVTAAAVSDDAAVTTVQGSGTVAGWGEVRARAGAAVGGPQAPHADVDGAGRADSGHGPDPRLAPAAASASGGKEPENLVFRHPATGVLAEAVLAAEAVVTSPPSPQLPAEVVVLGATAAVQVSSAATAPTTCPTAVEMTTAQTATTTLLLKDVAASPSARC